MDLFKECMDIAIKNYNLFLYFIAFAAAYVLTERLLFKKSFSNSERFNYYFLLTVIDCIFGVGLSIVFKKIFGNNPNKIVFIAVFAILSFFAGAVASLFVKKAGDYITKKPKLDIVKNNAFGIVLFFIFMLQYVLTVPNYIAGWHEWSYAVDYSMGFASRFLAGQILTTLCGGYVSGKSIYVFCFAVGIILIIIASALLNAVYKKADDSIKPAIFFITACFAACPVNIIALLTVDNFGRLEIFGLILSLTGVCAFNKIKNVTIRYIVLTILSVLSLLFYHGYAFLYYNILLVTMLYDIIGNDKIDIKKALYGISSVGISFVSFLYLQFFGKVTFSSAEEMVSALSQKTNIKLENITPIKCEYFSSLKESYELVEAFLNRKSARENFLVELILLIPLIYFLLIIVNRLFNENRNITGQSRMVRVRSVLCLMTSLLVIPQFILNTDWGRWLIALFTFVFFFILYFAYKNDSSMISVFEKLSEKIKSKPYAAILLVVYLGILSKVREMIFPDSYQVFDLIDKLF